MKSLDIDFENIALDDYSNHQVKIEYTGGIQRGRVQGRTHTVTVAYTSLSKKLQEIHRLGGKIIDVYVPRLQLDLTKVKVDAKHDDVEPIHNEHDEIVAETIPEITLESTDKPESEPEKVDFQAITEILVDKATELQPVTESEPVAEKILEIVFEKIDAIPTTTAAVEEVTVVTPKKSTASPAIASKPKKSRTSTKNNHGFSKRDTKPQTEESKTIADLIETSSQLEELKSEQVAEPVSKIIFDQVEQVDQVAKSVEIESLPIPEAISEQAQILEPVVEVKSSSTKKASPRAKKPKATKIANEILQGAKETFVEPKIDLPVPELAEVIPELTLETSLAEVNQTSESVVSELVISEITTEQISASIPEPSSISKSLAKSKKSKAANKSGHGFNKSKGDR